MKNELLQTIPGKILNEIKILFTNEQFYNLNSRSFYKVKISDKKISIVWLLINRYYLNYKNLY